VVTDAEHITTLPSGAPIPAGLSAAWAPGGPTKTEYTTAGSRELHVGKVLWTADRDVAVAVAPAGARLFDCNGKALHTMIHFSANDQVETKDRNLFALAEMRPGELPAGGPRVVRGDVVVRGPEAATINGLDIQINRVQEVTVNAAGANITQRG